MQPTALGPPFQDDSLGPNPKSLRAERARRHKLPRVRVRREEKGHFLISSKIKAQKELLEASNARNTGRRVAPGRTATHLMSHTGGRRSRGPCAKAQCSPFFTQWPRASVSWMHVPVL